ncbi:hypothetical protein A2U01_0081613, partial [Trifolium medium]|nr:hypothetical protein [Trifolium medium]
TLLIRACSPSDHASELEWHSLLSFAQARNFRIPAVFLSLSIAEARKFQFFSFSCRCSEELSECPSLSSAFSRPASVLGKQVLF